MTQHVIFVKVNLAAKSIILIECLDDILRGPTSAASVITDCKALIFMIFIVSKKLKILYKSRGLISRRNTNRFFLCE